MRNYEYVDRKFYERISGKRVNGVEEIPADVLQFMAHIPYTAKAEPLIAEMLEGGNISLTGCADYFGVGRTVVNKIRDRYKITVQGCTANGRRE